MDDKPIDLSNDTKNNSLQAKKPDAENNSSKIGVTSNIVRVPKQQAVVSPIKKRATSNKTAPKSLKELKKKKTIEEKQKQKEEKQIQKLEKQEQKKEKQKAVEKDKATRESKTKDDKKREIKERKKQKQEQKERAKEKDYNLDNLTALENIVLRRIEEKEEKKRRKIIILLIIFLVIMITLGSCTAIGIIEEHRPQPIAVDIVVEANWLGRELIDPNNPDAGFKKVVLYPGDIINVDFSVFNLEVTKNFPVFVRFRVYIIIEELTEHHLFIPTFKNPEAWYFREESTQGVQIDDWFYYGALLQTGFENKLHIIERLKLKEDLSNDFQGKDFTLVLEVEAVEGNVDAVSDFETWWLAPEEWLDLMGITIDD